MSDLGPPGCRPASCLRALPLLMLVLPPSVASRRCEICALPVPVHAPVRSH